MDYKGKLYGKVSTGRTDRSAFTYIPLLHTTEDWDNMVETTRGTERLHG